MPQKLNAKGKPFSWSYSAWDDFNNPETGCPLRYAAKRFYFSVPFEETEAIKWGNRVHRAAELFLRGVNPKDDEALAPVEAYCTAMLRTGYTPESELEIALTEDFKPVSWFATNAWFRAKLDVTLTHRARGWCFLADWKTGGRIKDDDTQLRINAAALSVVRPALVHFEGKYIWTKHSQVTRMRPLNKPDMRQVWQDALVGVRRMQEAWEKELFIARANPLCGWCPVANCPSRRK